MLFKCSWAFFILSVVCTAYSSALAAQTAFGVIYHFEIDTVDIEKNQTFSNRLIVENLLDREVILKADGLQTNALKGLINLPGLLVLRKNEKRSFPLKYIADGHSIFEITQAFTVSLKPTSETLFIQPSVSFYTHLKEGNSFNLATEQTDYFLDQATSQVQVMVQAENTSLVPVNFRIQFSEIPAGLEFTGNMMLTSLEAGAQALLPFMIRNNRKERITDFELTIQSIDGKGRRLASRRIRVISAGSVRRFGTTNTFSSGAANNSFALRYVSIDSRSSIYQVQGDGEMKLGKNMHLDYKLNMDYYDQLGGVNLYDTYLDFQTKKWGLKVGNIYENLDYTLSGKGVQGSVHFNQNKRLQVFVVDNDYLLYSIQKNRFPQERIIAADYTFKAMAQHEGRLIYLNSDNKLLGIRSNQVSGKLPVMLSHQQQLQLEGGYSLSEDKYEADKHAFSMGVTYNYYYKDYQLSSNQYFSSPYYTGLRRGLMQSDNQLIKLFKNGKSLSAKLSLMRINPRYISSEAGYRFDIHSQVNIAELGYRRPLGALVVEVKPYYMRQTLENEVNWNSKSLRTVVNLSFFRKDHRFNVNMDYGYTFENSANRPIAPFHSLRMNANYDYHFIGWSSYIQINPYYLSDLYSSNQDDNDYCIYSFGPNTHFSAFKDKLNLQLTALYNIYGFSQTKNLSVNGNLAWKLGGMWNLTADVFMTRMDNQLFNSDAITNRQVRLGIEKKFNTNMGTKGRKLALTYFQDLNNNGLREEQELAIEGILVQIDNQTAITNKEGKVQFQNMNEGAYAINIVNSQGWTTDRQMSVMMNKNKSLEVPLIKTAVLKGEIQLAGNRYEQSKPSFSGIRINAVDSEGKVYNTLSDAAGHYTLYLPPSEYALYINTEGMTFTIENQANSINLKEGNGEQTLNFTYKDNRRKVDIKKF